MSEWLKLIECKYTPSSLFTIYDYTKIVYPIDNNFYLKQVITPSEKSSFIPIKHNFDKIHSIHGALNNIITVEQVGAIYYVGFYAMNAEEERLRITWNISDRPINIQNSIVSGSAVNGSLHISNMNDSSEITIRSLYSQEILMICATDHDKTVNQIVMVHCKEKCIIGRGFVEGNIHNIALGPNCSISFYLNKSIVAFKNEPTADRQVVGRLYKQAEASLSVEIEGHFWIDDELLVWGKNKAYIIIKNKINQQFTDFHRLHNAIALVCGFIACDGCVIKVFKKKNIKYELICEIIDQHLMQCRNLSLSPQQDILAYFTPNSDSLIVSCNFNDQIEQAQSKENALQMALTLKFQQIGHQKSYDYTIYSSAQSWFASVNGTIIRLINSHNYGQFLSIELATDEKDKSYISSDLKPRHLAIHPTRPMFAVALKKMVRLYYVTFNQIKLLKEFNVSMVGYLLFNKSGSLLTAVVSGKIGAKLYISKINEIKGDFTLLETITVGKKPIALEWDSLDCVLYSFHKEGYYSLSLLNKFKQRKQVELKFKSEVQGALLSREDNPIYWGQGKVITVLDEVVHQQQSIKQTNVQQISLEGDYYYFVFEDGKIGRNKELDLQTSYSKSMSLSSKGKKYEIRMQQGNKIICLSEDLNVKYYQYGNGTSTFTDVVGVQKKKLYQIMGKHKKYQDQIKNLKQQFSSIVTELKAKAIAEQQKIEQEYKYELKDHIQREKMVKQEKNKLEEVMEKNLQIKQKESMHQIKQLERLYQRKIALTTNKLLTEKQIGYRDKILADNNLKNLEGLHSEGIEKVRKEFGEQLKSQLFDRSEAQRQLNIIKKQYEARLYELEQENQILLKGLQQKNQTAIIALKKMVNNWQNKYSECISQKDNVEKQYDEQLQVCAHLKEKISFLEVRKMEAERRCENLLAEIGKLEGFLEERNKTLQFYEKRIQDLQKSNEILKYRVLEVKEQNDPYEAEITKLKQNLTDLEEEYEKLIKSSYEQQQKMDIVKKQKSKLKEDNEVTMQKYLKLSKRYQQLLDKVRQTTKSPIQQIRKQLLTIVDSYVKINKSTFTTQKRADSPLGELNRIRDHLEVCLDQAVTTNKKNEEQRKIQMTKKNRENSELIIQINTMRKKIKNLEQEIKEKNLKISRLIRGETPTVISLSKQDRIERTQKIEPTEAQSKEFTKTRSRQTFYEKNMFKSGTHWNQKRLKTEQGSRRKKSSLSMMRDRNNPNSLYIHQTQNDEIEEYKRIVEQKDIFIQKLIAKIQKS